MKKILQKEKEIVAALVLVAETERVNGLLKNKALLTAERVIDQHEALLAADRVQQFKMDEE